jgi:hypothetical protein
MTTWLYPTHKGTFRVEAPDMPRALTAFRAVIIRSGAAVAFPQATWIVSEPATNVATTSR